MKKLSREEILMYLEELKEYYESETKTKKSKVDADLPILEELKLVDGSPAFKNFITQFKNSFENKLIEINNKIGSYARKIELIDSLYPIIRDFDFAVKIYNANYLIESTGAQVVKELKNFTKDEFISNLKMLEEHRKEVLENITAIVNDNDIALKELKNKMWGKDAKFIFTRMIKRLEVMNKQQRPEIANNRSVLTNIKTLIKILEKEELAVDVLNTILQIHAA